MKKIIYILFLNITCATYASDVTKKKSKEASCEDLSFENFLEQCTLDDLWKKRSAIMSAIEQLKDLGKIAVKNKELVIVCSVIDSRLKQKKEEQKRIKRTIKEEQEEAGLRSKPFPYYDSLEELKESLKGVKPERKLLFWKKSSD